MRAPVRLALFGATLAGAFAAGTAVATGFEKPVVLSGRYGAIAGAAASSVSGPESLIFNPAGLAGARSVELAVVGSPFVSTKSGPVWPQGGSPTGGAADVRGKASLALPAGAFASMRVLDRLGVGVGFFAVAGGGGSAGEMDFGPAFSLRPELAGGMGMNELAIGAGYQVSSALRIGASWRATFVKARVRTPVAIPSSASDPTPAALYALELSDLSGTSARGFRAGVQYEPPGGAFGLGASVRSSVGWTARGRSSALAQLPGDPSISAIPGGRVEAAASLPWQVAVGGHWAPTRRTRLLAQYELTNSSDVDELRYSGDPIGALDLRALSSAVKWRDMHTLRVGAEHVTGSIALRAGYAASTQVTRTDRANIFAVPPGASHTFIAGVGRRFLEDALGVDVAFDFSRDVGTASGSTEPGFLDGRYSVWAATVHAGASYRF